MKIGFIGAGKVGFSLGKYFVDGSIQVTGYYSRHRESADEAAEFTGTKSYDDVSKLVCDSDAVFITVPDGQITSVYEGIRDLEIKDKQICHCSGAMTAAGAFPGIAETGAAGYSIHPLFPVSSKYESYKELQDAFFCLEGDERHLGQWVDIFAGLGNRTRIIDGGSKTAYHAACCMSSNLVCGLIGESIDMFVSCGFTYDEALEAAKPSAA